MKHTNALIEKLSRSSLRQHRGLMILLVLVSLLVGISYWAIHRVLEEQQQTVRFHFARLIENISEQEVFLITLAQLSKQGMMLSNEVTPIHDLQQIPEEGPHIYQGQEHAFSMPFSIKINPQKIRDNEYAKAFALGANLATFYSTFWSTSNYQSPQVFLINDRDNFDIAVPSSEHSRVKTLQHDEAVVDVVTRVIHHSRTPSAGRLIWTRFETATDSQRPPRFMAYTHLDLPASEMHIKGAQPRVIIATLLSLTQVDDYERTMDGAQYDHFTLVAPSLELLSGSVLPDPSLGEGVNFTSEGLQIKVSQPEGPGWMAIYTISYAHFFRYAMWSLIVVAASLLGMIGLGWATSRWYRQRIILPAQHAHARIAESEAFSRIVIDTAPTGLCVVRRSDNKVLMENQRAQQWQGSTQLAMALGHHLETDVMGEAYLEVEGRHLQVGFVSTRFKGEDARLYAFNDVSQHIEDASALKEARRAADAANEAKTLFLATMSHEIRTPLYGVLGTLELLGMTHLEPRQQEYLQTIQRSSATLFQLISDVLDVSKIESGQMVIERVEFCPLDLIEDTVHTYSAFAQRKGLQLYACTDATLPNRMLGDPMRIRQILNNLLSNAIKFTDNGHVVLRTRVLEMLEGKASLEFQVTDSGIGISASQQEKLFELFYQVQDACSEGGAGLGLPICWWLSEMMEGQLRVTSEPGLGSSFALRIQLTVVPGQLPDCESIVRGAIRSTCARHSRNWPRR
ncbi:signal transduction histidine kinase [Pseudomonas hunanensis]|nr:signal transduction histidine kinase [Pseudomonas hunanensis]